MEENQGFAAEWNGRPAGYFHQSSEAPYPIKHGWGYYDGVDLPPEDYQPAEGMTVDEFLTYRERLPAIGVILCWIPNGDVPKGLRYTPKSPDVTLDFSAEDEQSEQVA